MIRAFKYIAMLGVYLSAVAVVGGVIAARRYGAEAYVASFVAATLMWVAGSIGLALATASQTGTGRINCVLLAMLVRMAVALIAMVYFTQQQHPLAASGIVGLIALHYLAGLVVETAMFVSMAGSAAARTARSLTKPQS